MDSKMLNLGRAKKKLRYFQPEEKLPCSIKIKEVFSLNDLDHIFDDLDSSSGTPPLSPLPQSNDLAGQAKGISSPDLKPTSPFEAEEPEVLASENCIQEDHLNDKGSPFKESAPIKTSSPIDLIAAGDEAGDAGKPQIFPILFCVDDEPVAQTTKNLKEFHKECIPVPSRDLATEESQASAPEESPMDKGKDSNTSPSIVVQNNPSESLPKEQPKIQLIQLPDGKSNVEVKESTFQQKLRNAFKPKFTQKPKVQTKQASAPSSLDLDDEFMILEDDAPILFTIPKKTDPRKVKPPPEGIHTKPDIKKTASRVESAPLKQKEDKNKHRDETDAINTKKTKAKQGNTHRIDKEGSIAQETPEERTDPLTEEAGYVDVCELSPVPEASQESDLPGKPSSKDKTSKSFKLGKKNGRDDRAKKTASKMKKPAKVTVDSTRGQEKPAEKAKTKPSKAKSTVRVGDSESDALRSASPVEPRNDDAPFTNKQEPEGLEQVCNVDNNTESPLVSTEQPDMQIISAVKNASKQAPTKSGMSKRTVKVKKVQKTKEDAKIKLPVPDVPREGLKTSKRKRRPPGDWWLTTDNQNKANTQQQEVQEIESSKEIKKKKAPAKPLQISANSPEGQESHSETVRHVTVQKAVKKNKKSTGDQKNPKTGGRRKPKSASPVRHKMQAKTSTPVFGEEVAFESVQLSPAACSPPPRRNSPTPGEKRVFENIYMQHSQCRSAQKCPSSALHQPEIIPEKRQRKPTSSWWEVPISQRSVESSKSPLNHSPQKTKPSGSAFDKVTSVSRSQKSWKKKQMEMVHTPKTVKSSLATFDALLASVKPASLLVTDVESIQKGRRNLLHSLEDQSELSSENTPSGQQHGNSHATFDVYTSGVTMGASAANKRTSVTFSAGSSRATENDTAFKSGPSSLVELERFEQHKDSGIPSKKIPQMQHIPRVMADCDFCGPPLKPIILEIEDWDNLCVWFAHLWPSSSKDGKVLSIISPDDFHWHSHGGRAMGHMVDLQNNTFSNGKLLLGSYMKKPPQMDLHAVTVFNVLSSSVRVEIDGDKTVYSSGQTFMTPCGQPYSIHNIFAEPAVLWYHKMLQNHTEKLTW